MWADPLGNGKYRLDNIPLFAYDVNLGDVFLAKTLDGDTRPYFDKILQRSGNRTFRLTLAESLSSDAAERISDAKVALEGICNGSSRYGSEYFVYSVPPQIETSAIEGLLDEGEDDGLWSWELSTDDEGRHQIATL